VDDLTIWLTLASALAVCFFSAANYALAAYSPSRLLERLEERDRAAQAELLNRIYHDLLLMTATLRAVLNLAVLMLTVEWFSRPDDANRWQELLLAFLAAGGIVLIFGVAIPLSWSRHAAEPLLVAALPLLRLLHWLFQPALWLLRLFDPVMRRLLGIQAAADDVATPLQQEILDAVSEVEIDGRVDQSQKRMLAAVVDFPSITVSQIMTPRTDIQALEAAATLEDIKAFIAATGHSRVPVYEGDIDHVAGLLYVKDLIDRIGAADPAPFDLRKIVRQALFVPQSKSLRDLLGQFKSSKIHMAIVLDEFGGTAGLVTIEDVLEQIVGDIQDEYECTDESPLVRRLDDRTFEVSGRVRLEELNEQLRAPLPTGGDYDTLGGFVFATLGRIPSAGDAFDYQGFRFVVTEIDRTRVNTVRIEVPTGDTSDGAAA
jgi:putative hemolysin